MILIGLAGIGVWQFFRVLTLVLRWVPEPIGSRADMLTQGAQTTLTLTLTSGVLGLILGVVLGLGKLSPRAWLRWPVVGMVWLIQGTPLLVQILFVYFALPAMIPKMQLDEFSAGMLALALNIGAYNAEVIRAGILAVPKGQSEAARSLGLSQFKTMRLIILPQAIRIVIPPLVNNIVALLKDSSLVSSIGLLELALAGSRISSETFQPVPVLTTVAIVYLLLTSVLTLVARGLEKILRSGAS